MEGQSLQEKVRAAKRRREAGETVQVPIPGYRGMLVGVYALTDWETRVEARFNIQDAAAAGESRPRAVYDFSMTHLLASSKTVEAVDGTERQDLQLKLGLPLAGWLGLNETVGEGLLAATDEDALALVIDDGEDLITHANAVLEAQSGTGEQVNEAIVGESVAAS